MADTARIASADQILLEFMSAMDVTFPELADKLDFLYRLIETASAARTNVTDLILDGEFRIAQRSGAEPNTRRLAEITGLEPWAVRHRWRAWARRSEMAVSRV